MSLGPLDSPGAGPPFQSSIGPWGAPPGPRGPQDRFSRALGAGLALVPSLRLKIPETFPKPFFTFSPKKFQKKFR